jgi:hypothetical protein
MTDQPTLSMDEITQHVLGNQQMLEALNADTTTVTVSDDNTVQLSIDNIVPHIVVAVIQALDHYNVVNLGAEPVEYTQEMLDDTDSVG